MYEASSTEYIRIYERIVIEFFLRLKIHKIGTYSTRFDIENLNVLVAWLNYAT